ncbi:hypothetical protein EDC96DRAFT_613340 [Choanephora cucurbitarum]|nr:hypothetical protein EDC96DRAFT_613340 [Choanephora cucurbitarum]
MLTLTLASALVSLEFHGYEGEDFRHFKHTLDTFFSICGIHTGARKLTILVSQLRRAAATFYSRHLKTVKAENSEAVLNYEDVINVLQEKYITPALVQRFELAFNDMVARLYEAAELVEIDDDNMIHSRFRAGLLRPIRVFWIECSSKTFDDWVTMLTAGGMHTNRSMSTLLIIPFTASGSTSEDVSHSMADAFKYPNLEGQVYKNSKATLSAGKDGFRGERMPVQEEKMVNRRGVDTMGLEVEQLAARLKNLELHHMGQPVDSEGARSITPRYNQHRSQDFSEADIVNLIKHTIKNELRSSGSGPHRSDRYPQGRYDDARAQDGYNSRYHNRRRYNASRRPDYFDNDYASPGEGYYPNKRNNHHDPDVSTQSKNGF